MIPQRVQVDIEKMEKEKKMLKISILGMLITSFFVYIDQPTFGGYSFNFELDIWRSWNEKQSDIDSFKYLIYVIGLFICRIYLAIILFMKENISIKLFIYTTLFILTSFYGVSMSPFLFFKFFSYLPHIFFLLLSIYLSKKVK
jgi:hypothetical protein